jgi:hypothetical protein
MASNDPDKPKPEPPDSGPVAFIERIVRLPAANDYTPLRIICVLIIVLALTQSPMPMQLAGLWALVVLALSLGRLKR